MSNNNTSSTTAWAIKRLHHYYPGTLFPHPDDYIRGDYHDGKIVALSDRAAAQRIAQALYAQLRVYYLGRREYALPDYSVRRIKAAHGRVSVMSEGDAWRLLDLDYDPRSLNLKIPGPLLVGASQPPTAAPAAHQVTAPLITIPADLLADLFALARDACNARRDFARDTLDPAAVAAADDATATIVETIACLEI